MQIYLLSAAGVIFFSVIVSLLIPEGKLYKTITFVMRLICIVVLIQPVTRIFEISPAETSDNYFDSEYVSAQYSRHQSIQLEQLISDKFSAESDCVVEVVYDDGQFKVNGVEVALNLDDKKNIESIKSYLQELGYINITVYAKST